MGDVPKQGEAMPFGGGRAVPYGEEFKVSAWPLAAYVIPVGKRRSGLLLAENLNNPFDKVRCYMDNRALFSEGWPSG